MARTVNCVVLGTEAGSRRARQLGLNVLFLVRENGPGARSQGIGSLFSPEPAVIALTEGNPAWGDASASQLVRRRRSEIAPQERQHSDLGPIMMVCPDQPSAAPNEASERPDRKWKRPRQRAVTEPKAGHAGTAE